MVLFIFVIMLLNLGTPEVAVDRLKPQRPLAWVAGLGVIAILATVIGASPTGASPPQPPAGTNGSGRAGRDRQPLFTAQWLFRLKPCPYCCWSALSAP